MSDSNGVEQVTQGVGQLSTSNGVKPGTVEGQSFKTKAKIVFKPSSAGDGGIGTNIFGTEKPDIKPSSNVNPNTNTEVAPVSWNKPAPVDAPISWDKPSVDVAPISWDKPSVDVAPISWDKPVAESAPVSWNKPVAEIAPISWDKPADTDAEINAVSWETPDSKPKEEPIYAKVNKSQIVPAGNGSASTSNEWVPSFNITDGTQLYLNETATPDMNFSPLNATTVVDDEDDANKVSNMMDQWYLIKMTLVKAV
uniref:Myosin light chain kinase, smooth muscle-like n=1 Tax=Saccoglossus kowalevskii TaxID=10224 RepID=A0ABM0MZ29_SACKO|nr:PREDICTED: myosin light chain kinase, smooth muscle-like [Saccoglossus kowalevskii]